MIAFPLSTDDLWTMLTASVCALACAIPGCFLVLRRMSLLGDALSHALLPGLAIAFMVSGSRALAPMMVGALAAGLLTALLSSGVQRWGRVPEDSALGVVFTTLFALGVVLISWSARSVDLDPGCVLYGALEFVSFDRVQILTLEVPRVLITLSFPLLLSVILLVTFYKEITLASFDATLAKTLGFSPALINISFLVIISLTTVASFEAVGSILVVTMLVAPAATAHLLTDRLQRLILVAAAISVVSAVCGYLGALVLNTSVAGMISVVACLCFLAAVIGAPQHGIAAHSLRRLGLLLRITREDILGVLYRAEEALVPQSSMSRQSIQEILTVSASPWLVRWQLRRLGSSGLVIVDARGRFSLTGRGRAEAASVVRGHRLWESFLDKFLKLPLDHLHEPSHRVEHYLSSALQHDLEQQVAAKQDPHGRRIPEEKESNDQ